ncbi:MAG: hypothetical protein JRI36_03995 [Deltaproteobacteria bacterium]|nr:hypothetical protein [Deltaproteobacteria bacterium]
MTKSIVTVEEEIRVAVIVSRDLSERKRAERERVRREKLEAIIEMAGAVCHEMNQPMQAISGYCELLMDDAIHGDRLCTDAKKIHDQVMRMAKIMKKLMGITKYETKDYVFEGRKIIDIDRASEQNRGIQGQKGIIRNRR